MQQNFVNFVPFLSQGSAATRLRCGAQCDMGFVVKFLGEHNSENILKIGQHLSKL